MPTPLLCTHLIIMTTLVSPAALTVNISVSYTPPPGFIPGDSTEYKAASGPVIVTAQPQRELGVGIMSTCGRPPVVVVVISR